MVIKYIGYRSFIIFISLADFYSQNYQVNFSYKKRGKIFLLIPDKNVFKICAIHITY